MHLPDVNDEDVDDEIGEEDLFDHPDDDDAGSDPEAEVSEEETDYYPGLSVNNFIFLDDFLGLFLI